MFYVGDRVKVAQRTCLGGLQEVPKGLEKGIVYTIIQINRGIDGAWDWDDIWLEGISGRFCEFDFEEIA